MCNRVAHGLQYHFRFAFFKIIALSPNFNSLEQLEQKFFPIFDNLDICAVPILVMITGNLKPRNEEFYLLAKVHHNVCNTVLI